MHSAHAESGVVEAVLPKGLYKVRLDGGPTVTASLGSLAKRVTVKIIQGDRVLVERSPYDPTRARITARTA